MHDQRTLAIGVDPRRGRGRRLLIAVGVDDPEAVEDEPGGDRLAEPAARPGDDRDPSRIVRHSGSAKNSGRPSRASTFRYFHSGISVGLELADETADGGDGLAVLGLGEHITGPGPGGRRAHHGLVVVEGSQDAHAEALVEIGEPRLECLHDRRDPRPLLREEVLRQPEREQHAQAPVVAIGGDLAHADAGRGGYKARPTSTGGPPGARSASEARRLETLGPPFGSSTAPRGFEAMCTADPN